MVALNSALRPMFFVGSLNILVRSKKVDGYLSNLKETFDDIRRACLRLKAKKYAFRVNEEQFLGL